MDDATESAAQKPITNPPWPELVFDPSFLAKLDKLAQKRFCNSVLAEECSAYVLDALSKDNWQRCEKYQGLSKPTTFLYSVSTHLIEEFSRSKFGRPRPPSWLHRQGELWVSLWRAICLERQLVPAVIDRFKSQNFDVELVTEAIRVIKGRIPNCGQEGTNPIMENPGDEADLINQMEADDMLMDDRRFKFEHESGDLIHSLLKSIMTEEGEAIEADCETCGPHELSDEHLERLKQIKASLSLTDKEKILMRMVYVDGLSKTKAAKALNIPSHQGGKLINSVLERIKNVFLQCQLDIDSLYKSLI
jgi:DNA-directed RNA polymerase specialized sigma24 family protein